MGWFRQRNTHGMRQGSHALLEQRAAAVSHRPIKATRWLSHMSHEGDRDVVTQRSRGVIL